MKTLSDITGGARANKTSTLPLRYSNLEFPHKSRLTLRSGTALNGAGLLSIIVLSACGGGGGEGADIYVIDIGGTADNGSDTITDFDVTSGTGDIVQIAWQENSPAPSTLAAAGLALGTNGSNAVLTDSTDTSIIYLTFEGIAQADLAEATHFEFV